MTSNKVYKMSFSKIYTLLIAKAEKKGRTRDEIDEITCWLTGYSKEQIADFLVNEIEEPLMQEIRYLDKLVDELAKGKALEKILRN